MQMRKSHRLPAQDINYVLRSMRRWQILLIGVILGFVIIMPVYVQYALGLSALTCIAFLALWLSWQTIQERFSEFSRRVSGLWFVFGGILLAIISAVVSWHSVMLSPIMPEMVMSSFAIAILGVAMEFSDPTF